MHNMRVVTRAGRDISFSGPKNVGGPDQSARAGMQARAGDYGSTYRTVGTSSDGDCLSGDVCGMCSTLICCDTCCECMGGDLIRCC